MAQVFVLLTLNVEDKNDAPGFWLQPSPGPAVVAIYTANQQMKISLILPLLSVILSNKTNLLKGE